MIFLRGLINLNNDRTHMKKRSKETESNNILIFNTCVHIKCGGENILRAVFAVICSYHNDEDNTVHSSTLNIHSNHTLHLPR